LHRDGKAREADRGPRQPTLRRAAAADADAVLAWEQDFLIAGNDA
jgi:hypothetical protein